MTFRYQGEIELPAVRGARPVQKFQVYAQGGHFEHVADCHLERRAAQIAALPELIAAVEAAHTWENDAGTFVEFQAKVLPLIHEARRKLGKFGNIEPVGDKP